MAPNNTITQVIYTGVPKGLPSPTGNFEVRKVPFDPKTVEVPESHVLVKPLYLSIDPYMRLKLRDPKIPGFFPAAIPGEPFSGEAVVEVVRSNHPKYGKGEVLTAHVPWQEYAVIPLKGEGHVSTLPKRVPRNSKLPLSYYLGVLGMPGITAYSGLHKCAGTLKAGETIYVSSAFGAVGQIVGQYAKSLGLRVVGSAGSDDKVSILLNELGFDAAFNYKKHEGVEGLVKILKETCPQGIDIYFDNVGGEQLEAVLEVANNFARITACGMLSQYNQLNEQYGVKGLFHIIGKRIEIQGLVCYDHLDDLGEPCNTTFTNLLTQGKMKYKESVTEGLANAPQALVNMLEGKASGKAVVKVGDLDLK